MAPGPFRGWLSMSRALSSLLCLFTYDTKPGGSVHAALNVCKYLAQAGQPVEVVAFREASREGAFQGRIVVISHPLRFYASDADLAAARPLIDGAEHFDLGWGTEEGR